MLLLQKISAPGGVFAADVTSDRVSVTMTYIEAQEVTDTPVMHVEFVSLEAKEKYYVATAKNSYGVAPSYKHDSSSC